MLCLVAGMLALGVGCQDKKQWLDVRARQLHVGALEADIPAGWRDLNELADRSSIAKVPPGTRVLLHEDLRDYGEIMVFPILAPIAGDDCAKFATGLDSQSAGRASFTNVQGASFAGNPGCMMSVRVENLNGTLRVVTPKGGSTVGVRCLGGTRDLDYACEKIVYGLHPTKPTSSAAPPG